MKRLHLQVRRGMAIALVAAVYSHESMTGIYGRRDIG